MEEAAAQGTSVLVSFIIWLVVGGVAGWLASNIVKGGGMGLMGNIVLGIAGAIVAGWIFPLLGFGFGGGVIAAILSAMVGAIIVLLAIGLAKRA